MMQNKELFNFEIKQSNNIVVKTKKPTCASLFAGVGGVDLGFKNAGFSILWANEIDSKACATYNANFGHKIICDDIKNLKQMPKVDILTAGFPCQAFSIAGYQKGFEDERGSLVFEVLRLVKEIEPQVLFLENVKNLISHNKAQTFKDICLAIESLGYFIKHKVLNTCDYSNLPQNRERVYIVCFKNKNAFDRFYFPEKVQE